MNPFDPEIFAAENPCVCCSGPAELTCALLIPPFDSPYASYADAAAAISDKTDGCLGFAEQDDGSAPDVLVFTEGMSVNIFEVQGTVGNEVTLWVKQMLNPATNKINITYDQYLGHPNVNQITLDILDPITGAVLYTQTAPSGTGDFGPFSTVQVVVRITGHVSPFDDIAAFTYISDKTANLFLPVIAQWDDSGTTRKLEACPKLYLPPLTDSTGEWYADCGEASSAISDMTSNCVAYTDIPPDDYLAFSFSGTNGGSSLTFNAAAQDDEDTEVYLIALTGSINAEAGQTLSMAWSYAASASDPLNTQGASIAFYVTDDAGSLVDFIHYDLPEPTPSDSGTLTSIALPYTGRYTVSAHAGSTYVALPGETVDYSLLATITSSGTLTVNPIQALYDAGLDCPARLNCGDACP